MKPVEVRRRVLTARAVRVTYDNLADVARWCAGHTWASSVVVPVDGGEQSAPPGTWVVLSPHGWQVWPDHRFRAEWAPTDGLPARPPAG